MSTYVRIDSYVSVHSRLYTESFAVDGGSVVRAALGDQKTRQALRRLLRSDAEAHKYIFAEVDGGETRLQQLQDVFFAISLRINWIGTVRRWLRRALSEEFQLDGIDLTFEGLLRNDTREAFVVRRNLEDVIGARLLRKEGLSGEFRRAIYHLVWAVLEPHSVRSDSAEHVIAWLTGRLEKISLVKPALLFRRITKVNARQMIASLSRWLRDSGFSGLVVPIDLGAVMTPPRFAIGQRYTRAALMDVYEVLRQFIDAVDEVEGLVVLVLAPEAFADDETRGATIYRALRMRLSDDVWDSRRANPMANMVRISE